MDSLALVDQVGTRTMSQAEVEAYAANVARQIAMGSASLDAVISQAYRTFTPECCCRFFKSFTNVFQLASHEALVGRDTFGGNQMIPLDTGSTFVAGFADTVVFTVKIQSCFRLLDIIATDEMGTKFGLLQAQAAGFGMMNLGFNTATSAPVVGGGALSLAMLTPAYDRYANVPILGRQYPANTEIVIQARELTGNPNRFLLSLLAQIQACPHPNGERIAAVGRVRGIN